MASNKIPFALAIQYYHSMDMVHRQECVDLTQLPSIIGVSRDISVECCMAHWDTPNIAERWPLKPLALLLYVSNPPDHHLVSGVTI